MKPKLFIIIILLLLSVNSLLAQSYKTTLVTCSKSFTIICEPLQDNGTKVSVRDDITDSLRITYKIYTSDMEIFAKVFAVHFSDSSQITDSCKHADTNNLLIFGRKLLKDYTTALVNIAPVAGIFSLRDSVKVYQFYLDGNNNVQLAEEVETKYKIAGLDAEINDGYLENIKVYIKLGDIIKTFIAPFPIGMSSVSNFKKYDSTRLYYINSSPYISKDARFFIYLGDIIDYNYKLGTRRRDYSPKDTTFENLQGGTSLALHKEETKKLFSANIYSDFKGLDESSPNGILQMELEKRINLNTTQHLSAKWLYWFFGSYGFAQHITPVVSFQKIEQHNKKLVLNDLDSLRLNPGTTDPTAFGNTYHRYVDALSLYQHQWLSAGFDFNLFYLNNHDLKYNIYFNVGGRVGFTQVTDSLTTVTSGSVTKTGFTNDYTVTTGQAFGEIKLLFFPEERFNLAISNKWLYYKPFNPYIQLTSFDKDDPQKLSPVSSSWFYILDMQMQIETNPNSKLFGRVRVNWDKSNMKNNFAQIQVGYSTYILGK